MGEVPRLATRLWEPAASPVRTFTKLMRAGAASLSPAASLICKEILSPAVSRVEDPRLSHLLRADPRNHAAKNLCLAVVREEDGAATIGVVPPADRRGVEGAVEVVAGILTVELAVAPM